MSFIVVLLKYTGSTMNSSLKNRMKKGKSSPKRNISVDVVVKNKKFESSKKKTSSKPYGKILLRRILLSKSFYKGFQIVFGLLVIGLVCYGGYSLLARSFGDGVVVSKSQIVDRVAKLTSIPAGMPDALVRVEDAETLKLQNSFYENVKNGDYILIYPKVAVIYDLMNNAIVAIKKGE